MSKILTASIVGFALAGCATAYQPSGFTGGYTDLKMSADTYQITVEGNGYTSTTRAENIALLRAADLTIRDGYERFIVLGGRGVAQENAGSTPVTFNRVGNSVVAFGGDSISKPNGNLVIRMLKKNDPAFASGLDAQLIASQLKAKLGVTS